MQDISTLGRITSGVKMMNLDEGIKIAQIAKVREKISNGEQEFDNVEDAMENMEEEYPFEADTEELVELGDTSVEEVFLEDASEDSAEP